MKSKKRKSKVSIATSLIYILFLLVVVLGYMMFLYPKFSLKIAQNEANTKLMAAQVNMLTPYESQIAKLLEREKELTVQYKSNNELRLPVEFADLIYSAVDESGIVLKNLAIGEEFSMVTQQGYPAKQYSSTLVGNFENREVVVKFLNSIEKHKGVGIFVDSITYTYPEVERIGVLSAKIVMTTVGKEESIVSLKPTTEEAAENANSNSSSEA